MTPPKQDTATAPPARTMHNFDYAAPVSLQDALKLLAESNTAARPLAGGTDLIDQMRTGRLSPELVVDVKRIPELNVLEVSDSGLRLGAAVPCCRIYESQRLSREHSALAESCRIIGGVQIQSRASVGGNLCNSGPAADSTPSLIALQAACVIAGINGAREVPVEEFCTGPGKNVLQPGELLVELRLPPRLPFSGSHYRRFIPRNEMDIAVVGVGVSVTLDAAKQTIVAARIALGAVGPTPIFAADAAQSLVGQPPNEAAVRKAAEAAKAVANPIDDMRGTAEFRRHITGVLTQRVLKTAIARAQSEDEGSNH
ncbi:MAG: FAD binding domain-containing protein [Planctomycetaceae bacterium]